MNTPHMLHAIKKGLDADFVCRGLNPHAAPIAAAMKEIQGRQYASHQTETALSEFIQAVIRHSTPPQNK